MLGRLAACVAFVRVSPRIASARMFFNFIEGTTSAGSVRQCVEDNVDPNRENTLSQNIS